MAKTASENTIIKINPIKIQKLDITIVGDTPLLVHAWSEKAKREMLEAQQKLKKDKKAKEIRNPFREYVDAMYWITPKPDFDGMTEAEMKKAFEKAVANGAKFGFPIIAIKQGAMEACYHAGLAKKTFMRSAFYINQKGGTIYEGNELAVIETSEPPAFREDMVKIGGMTKVADLRYRPEFRNWKMHLTVSLIDTGVFTMESIVNAINLCGYMNGIGEWRMERDGNFGHFHVETEG